MSAAFLPVDPEIQSFLDAHHVLSLCTSDGEGGRPYAANCYYVFLNAAATLPARTDAGRQGDDAAYFEQDAPLFVVLSDRKTRHGREMLESPAVAGTVHVEPPPGVEGVAQIQGVQFTGRARMILEEEQSSRIIQARESYYQKFEYARKQAADCWIIAVDFLKMTDNSVRFGFKRFWPEPPQ
ncbi:MAG: pyridoxamine 5'-phosphate oxidase family protein [bacterium]|nr:pyridoxamine 5'-phosphate oxidase family protein [bacterium]